MKQRKRNLGLTMTPNVTHNSFSGEVLIETGGLTGQTWVTCRGTMSMYCAAHLVVELRKALRAIRREQIMSLNSSIAKAEQDLP